MDHPRPLEELRRLIDEADEKIVALLNERAGLVVEVGKRKQHDGTPIYAPDRERMVLDKAKARNKGPLSDTTIEAIYRQMMSGSFALERPLRIGYLGPAGSYSHLAARAHFGASVEFASVTSIGAVFDEVIKGHVDYGLAPIENSTAGGIVETLDAFIEHAGEVSIYAEAQVVIRHALMAGCPAEDVTRIHSKPEVFAQCHNWLSARYPKAELIPAASSSRAAITAAEETEKARGIGARPGSAAIGTPLAAELYGLSVLVESIQDQPNNITRFVILSREKTGRTGQDKTSMLFETSDEPGALADVLAVFSSHGVNLTHIEKRPSGRENWTYMFFIDAAGHMQDEAVVGAIEAAKTRCRRLTVLGSYPRAKGLL
ncbi:MAG: prephenate dehydratase [Phycisphaerales bacterium JB060]